VGIPPQSALASAIVAPGFWSTMPLSSPSPASSLQELLQSSAAQPDCIQIKAKGLKTILRSVAEFLETYQVQANVFAKLPRGAVWQEDIQRYGQMLDDDHHLVQFVRPGATIALPPTLAPSIIRPPVPVRLAEDQGWAGEYFVLVQAETFAALVVAHRLQRLPAAAPDEDHDLTLHGEDEDSIVVEHHPQVLTQAVDPTHRSVYLSVGISIHPTLIQEMQGILHPVMAQQTEANPVLAGMIQRWERYCPPIDPANPSFLGLVDRWLLWHLRLQEHLRQTMVRYRQQALEMSSLSSQNEVLINTLRLKDEFLNTVGQELRTPLTTIKTALTLLDSPHLKPSQRQRYIDMISHECNRQSALISGVLNLLQIETNANQTQLVPVHLDETVPPVVSTYQPLAEEKGVMLAYTIPNSLPKVACPEAWLRQIMIHLLNNSIKYTQSGGEVWVTARPAEDVVEIEVRDTGIGIAPQDLPQVFDYFYRGRSLPGDVPDGAGLGLSIAQQLLMLCGGTIVVSSQVDQGTTFRVRMPIYEG
jgi:two-component system, OmpR family, phosphate regulon sensor histidine kinase PhoR